MGADDRAARALVEDVYQAGLDAVEPQAAVARAFDWRDRTLLVANEALLVPGRIVVVAVGKAATPMALGAVDVLGDAIDDGIILTKDDHLGGGVPGFRGYEAAHPVPDGRGVAATEAILRVVQTLGAADLLLALISGGGSALLEAPVAPVTLQDLQRTTELLLRAGAPIQDLNAVRSELSAVKGGGLRTAAGAATCVSLILSDVLGNDPATIASGPTRWRQPSPASARRVLERYGISDSLPTSVHTRLQRSSIEHRDDVSPSSFKQDRWVVVGDNDTLVDAAAARAGACGLSGRVAWRRKEGEAAELARTWVGLCHGARADVDVLLGGGEATVTVHGDGRGGRNTEFALAAALALAADDTGWTVASLASDGDDGVAAATGAVVTAASVAQMRRVGVDPEEALRRNDSASALAAIGALVQTGPTGTNVNDLYFAVRNEAAARQERTP